MVAPVAPHLAEERWWEAFGHRESVFVAGWPAFDPSLAREESVTLVVQVDGRVRDRLDVPPSIGEDEARERAMTAGKVASFLTGRQVVRVIVRAPRLVNIVTAGCLPVLGPAFPWRPSFREFSPNVTDDTDGASTLR